MLATESSRPAATKVRVARKSTTSFAPSDATRAAVQIAEQSRRLQSTARRNSCPPSRSPMPRTIAPSALWDAVGWATGPPLVRTPAASTTTASATAPTTLPIKRGEPHEGGIGHLDLALREPEHRRRGGSREQLGAGEHHDGEGEAERRTLDQSTARAPGQHERGADRDEEHDGRTDRGARQRRPSEVPAHRGAGQRRRRRAELRLLLRSPRTRWWTRAQSTTGPRTEGFPAENDGRRRRHGAPTTVSRRRNRLFTKGVRLTHTASVAHDGDTFSKRSATNMPTWNGRSDCASRCLPSRDTAWASPADRRAEEQGELLRRMGAQVVFGPVLRTCRWPMTPRCERPPRPCWTSRRRWCC